MARRAYRRFSKEFKLEDKQAAAFSSQGRQTGKDTEIQRLRRELADAREENEILKKAAAYFARNQQ